MFITFLNAFCKEHFFCHLNTFSLSSVKWHSSEITFQIILTASSAIPIASTKITSHSTHKLCHTIYVLKKIGSNLMKVHLNVQHSFKLSNLLARKRWQKCDTPRLTYEYMFYNLASARYIHQSDKFIYGKISNFHTYDTAMITQNKQFQVTLKQQCITIGITVWHN